MLHRIESGCVTCCTITRRVMAGVIVYWRYLLLYLLSYIVWRRVIDQPRRVNMTGFSCLGRRQIRWRTPLGTASTSALSTSPSCPANTTSRKAQNRCTVRPVSKRTIRRLPNEAMRLTLFRSGRAYDPYDVMYSKDNSGTVIQKKESICLFSFVFLLIGGRR